MHSPLRQFAIFVASCLFLCACHSRNRVELTEPDFGGEIQQRQNLRFAFNKDLQPDSLLKRWDSTTYAHFEPAVRGSFQWLSSNELVFSPADGFRPSTDYEVTLTSRVLDKAPHQYRLGKQTYRFHTAPLRVESATASWTRNAHAPEAAVQVDLGFNYGVSAADVAAHLKLQAGGQRVPFTPVPGGTGTTVSVQMAPLNAADAPVPLQVVLQSGSKVAGGGRGEDTAFTIDIPSRYNLTVTEVTGQHSGTEGVVTVVTSQPLTDADLKGLVSLEPAVPFEAAPTTNGFTLTSARFDAGTTYELTLSAAAEGAYGGRMRQAYSQSVAFGRVQPAVQFVNEKGMYLSSRGCRNLALSLINVPGVDVTVIKVYENNLEHLFRRGDSYDYAYDSESDESGSFRYYDTENLGDTVFHHTYNTAKLPGTKTAKTLHLDFEDKLKGYSGVYIVTVASTEHRWVQHSKILSLSDVGLIVKREPDRMLVFANSIRDATPLAGVRVGFVSTTNQVMGAAATNSDGVAVFDRMAERAPGFRAGMVTARLGEDFSVVWLDGSRVETSRFEVGGRAPNATGLNAFIYAERDLYRPGETARVSVVVRSERWQSPGEVPVKLRLNLPNGQEFVTGRKILNEEGSCELSFPIPPSAVTGTYTLEAYTGNDVLLATHDLAVEDFMPDRIKVALQLPAKEYAAHDTIRASVQADNLFGTPAAGRAYQYELSLDKVAFSTPRLRDYDFSTSGSFYVSPQFREGLTDARGSAAEGFALSGDGIDDAGMLKGTVTATVFDENGRPVHRYAPFTVYTQPVFIGMQGGEDYVAARAPVRCNLAAVDRTGANAMTDVDVTVLKKEWHTVIEQSGSSYQYVSQPQVKTVAQTRIRITGTSNYYSFVPPTSGDYEVRVARAGSANYVSRTVYAWGYDDGAYTSYEVNQEGNVDIQLSQEKYRVGEDINVLFTTPFEGRLLVTVERDRVQEYRYLDTRNKSASLRLKAGDEHLPNVYIAATLFRPMHGDALPLTVAHGYASVPVEDPRTRLPVEVRVAPQVRTHTRQSILVRTLPGAYVTVAAVDEGILQVRNSKTPDPHGYFFQKVALSIDAFDIYPLLLPEIRTGSSSTGGDGSGDGSANRVNPLFVNRAHLLSFWSGIRQADGRGLLRYDLDVPQFSGDVRVMVVAYKGAAFGSAEQHMKVADPVVVSTALPRFLSPKDQALVPVTLSNTTARAAVATVTVKTAGPLGVSGKAVQQVTLPAGREGRAVFLVDAGQAIGAGKVTVSVQAFGETFVDETDIAVRPPASLQKRTGHGATAGAVTSVPVATGFLPATFKGQLVVASNPVLQFGRNLQDLIRYPYGCVEQTTSTAFPQLYAADLVDGLVPHGNTDAAPAYNVQQAILKLQSMQLGNGALSYWPDGGTESWWGSIYACHFLLEARKAGYEVNAATVDRLLQYQLYKLKDHPTETYYFNGGQKRAIVPKEVPYSLYVLALAGRPQPATLNYYKGNPQLLALDSKYLIAAAYGLSGQPVQARQILPASFSGEQSDRTTGGSFYSYIRDQGVALNALVDLNPADPQIPLLARTLSQELVREKYLSTQENAFALLALGKIARRAARNARPFTVTAGGRVLAKSNGSPLRVPLAAPPAGPLQVQATGAGPLYYFWETSGLTADGSYVEEDQFLRVRRSYFDRTGKPFAQLQFRQNDLVIVKISLEPQYNGAIDNIAVTDLLPAGFEIENTRLVELPMAQWTTKDKDLAEPDYLDYRDDRLNLFTSLNGKRKTFYYLVRAVSPGVYTLGPVQADAMYNGYYHSYHGAGTVRISER